MKFKIWVEQAIEIDEPYYRIVSDIMHGANAVERLGSEIAPGTYWTPRWDAILFMVRSVFTNAMIYTHTRNSKIKIYKLDKAIMEPAPEDHKWAFKYSVDAGEMVLVKALEEPQVLYSGPINSPEIEDMVQNSFNYSPPVDHSKYGMRAKLKDGKEVFISPDYDKNAIDVVVPQGWKFNIIRTIRSADEWDKFYKTIADADWDSDQSTGLQYFFMDMGW